VVNLLEEEADERFATTVAVQELSEGRWRTAG